MDPTIRADCECYLAVEIISRLNVIEDRVALITALKFMPSAGTEQIGSGKLISLADRNVLDGLRTRAGRGTWKWGRACIKSTTSNLDKRWNKVVTELLVQKSAVVAAVDHQVAGRSVYARERNEIRSL